MRNSTPHSASSGSSTSNVSAGNDQLYHKVGSPSVTRNRALSRSSRKLLVVITVVVGAISFWSARKYNDTLLYKSFPRCSYHDLAKAFPQPREELNEEGKCWSLDQEILRIPSKSIHRHHLHQLGKGGRGAVFRAAIDLPWGGKCVVALKTDHCFTPLTALRRGRQTGHSCLEPHAYFGHNPKSYLGGEYTGAMLFHAQRHMNITLPGVPTWGIVEDPGQPIPMVGHERSDMRGMPHPNPDVKGVIMPLVDFVPLNRLSPAQRGRITRDASSVARIMLPVAEGLAFVNDMGFAHRDVASNNIGVILAGEDGQEISAFIYDNSFMAHQDKASCLLEGDGCKFCMDPAFAHEDPGVDSIANDMVSLRNVVLDLLDESLEEPGAKQDLIAALYSSANIHDMASALRAAK